MDNQDQHNLELKPVAGSTEFSTRRRLATAVLVLVAALLLGYVIYSMMFVSQPAEQPVESELSTQEQALQRLRDFEQRPPGSPSAPAVEQLDTFTQRGEAQPSQEQVDRLDQFRAGS